MFLPEEVKNVFESNRFCYLFSRFINFEFVTIERKIDGTIKGFTTKWDVLRFVFGISLGLFAFYDVFMTPLQHEKRSIIFEITMSLNSKIQGFTGSLVMLQVFLFRYEYLNIFNTLDWIDIKLAAFRIHRNYSKDFKRLAIILITYQIVINSNLMFGYYMVVGLGVKIKTVAIDRGFVLISLAVTVNYTFLSMLIMMTVSWRIRAIEEALILTLKSDKNEVLSKMKILMKMWCKIEDLINSLNKYLALNNILSFSNFFILFLLISFLGYDILAHNLGNDDVIFFLAGMSYAIFGGAGCVIFVIYSMTFKSTMKKSVKVFNQIAIDSNDRKIRKFCQNANLQLSSTQSELSCGLFGFKWSFIFTLMVAFFSYLLEMVQFDNLATFDALK